MAKKRSPQKKKAPLNLWMVGFFALLIIVVIAIVAFATGYVQPKSAESVEPVPASYVAANAMDFINNYILAGGANATLVGQPVKASGIYKFTLDVDGQLYDSFVTFDGKYLFPSGIDMTDMSFLQSDETELQFNETE